VCFSAGDPVHLTVREDIHARGVCVIVEVEDEALGGSAVRRKRRHMAPTASGLDKARHHAGAAADKRLAAPIAAAVRAPPVDTAEEILDLAVLHGPHLVLVVRVARPHVDFAAVDLSLACIDANAVLVFDPVDAGVVLELLVGVVGVARPHVDFAAVGATLTGVEADAFPRFDLVGGPVVRPVLVFVVDVALPHVNFAAVGATRIGVEAFAVDGADLKCPRAVGRPAVALTHRGRMRNRC